MWRVVCSGTQEAYDGMHVLPSDKRCLQMRMHTMRSLNLVFGCAAHTHLPAPLRPQSHLSMRRLQRRRHGDAWQARHAPRPHPRGVHAPAGGTAWARRHCSSSVNLRPLDNASRALAFTHRLAAPWRLRHCCADNVVPLSLRRVVSRCRVISLVIADITSVPAICTRCAVAASKFRRCGSRANIMRMSTPSYASMSNALRP